MTLRRPLAALGLLISATIFSPTLASEPIVFNRDIRPILSDNCFACHGPDANHRKGKLRLDERESAIARDAIVPNKLHESELLTRITSSDADKVMPPPHANKKLSAEQVELLRRWIVEGAKYQGHWAYEPPVPASVHGSALIDHEVGKRLATLGWKPSVEADRRTLIRRLSFDLLGLPPTSDAVEAFMSDTSPNAYERLVDQLLASPHYGERMALGWLDVVRFADTIGYHSDNPRNVWPYRDYVIRSFNENKRFDQFTIEQLAGDLLPNATAEQKIASCFNMLLLTTEEGGAQPKDYEARMLTDRVRAVGTVWLGQTLGCCQCHDHKFDPSTIRDFYAMGAFFADIQEPIVGRRPDGITIANDVEAKELAKRKAIAANTQKVAALVGVAPAKATELAANAFEAKLAKCMTSNSGKPRTVRILPRGNWMDDSGPTVTPGLPNYLVKRQPKPANGERLTRLDLAKWIVSPENTLTARVTVNRIWRQFFGVGLSKTTDDFGSQGDWPSHPELLDGLATDFIASGWDVKQLVRDIVLSRTYRQSSAAAKELLAKDPANRELARQSRFRLEAELVRDNALAISGLLVPTIGGPSVKPYQPDGYWENLNFPVRKYDADVGEKQYRRGMYTWWQRSFLHPSMVAFDAPSREECAAERTRSNIPQQALVLLNDPTYVEAARAFAARIVQQRGDVTAKVTWAYRRALQRSPTADETKVLSAMIAKHRAEYAANPKDAERVLSVGLAPTAKDLDRADLAAWTSAARVILNLHETITRN